MSTLSPKPNGQRHTTPERNTDPIKVRSASDSKSRQNRNVATSVSKRRKKSRTSYIGVTKRLFVGEDNGTEENVKPSTEWREVSDGDECEDDMPSWQVQAAKRYVATVLQHVKSLNSYEDDEELIFSTRGKLFKHCEGCWKERGVGKMKFLRHMEEGITYGTVRLTMCQEGSLRQILNHLVVRDIEVKSQRDNKNRITYYWSTYGEQEYGRYAVRFRTDRDAMEWKEAFERSKKLTTRARLCLDKPDTSFADDTCESFRVLSTADADESPKDDESGNHEV